jgi:PEGA domain
MPRVSVLPGAVAICLVVLCAVLAGCESTPAPLQENGSVRILSFPAGAAVYLDGEYRGTTPATVTAVPAGSHTLEVRADGYDRWTAPVTINTGSMANVSATLNAIPATALPVTFSTVTIPTLRPGYPEIHIEGYWSWPQGISSSTENPVPILVHADGFNVGDADARVVTASANLYYGGHQVCWKTVYFGTLKAGGHVSTDSMVTCSLPSNIKSGDLTIRFENVAVTP